MPVHVVAAGKAAWPMLRAFADHDVPIARGVVSAPRHAGTTVPAGIEWYEGAHPHPDAASEAAGRLALARAAETRAGGCLVVLLSGGASSMLAAPAEGLALADKSVLARGLMEAGVPIADLNCVRKHLSAIKGGRLAAAAGASVTFALSDVHAPVEDDPSVIGSGPTVADPTTFAEALRIVHASGVAAPPSAVAALERGRAGERGETPKPGDASLRRATYHLVGNRHTAMRGAAAVAQSLGYAVILRTPPLLGEARVAGAAFAGRALLESRAGPLCVIASGETTVRVRGPGRGGRCQEFVLAAIEPLEGWGRAGGAAVVAAAGTDGIDGPTDAAGGMADSATAERARAAALDWQGALDANSAYDFFSPLGDLLVWGPTGTNVGDVALLLRD